ncbi:MAG: GNAT family N-acetyltransferase [Gemmatimonadota bacterium]
MQPTYRLEERDVGGFFRVPFEAYPDDWPYASPMASDLRRLLDPRRNPFFGEAGDGTTFTAYRRGRPIGRISAHVHHDANRRFGLKRGYFGFFDVADDEDAGRLLLEAAESWVRERGCEEIAGNFNLTSVQEIGVMTSGYARRPYSAMCWTPPHLPGMLESAGYGPFFPMSTFELELAEFDPATLMGPRQERLLNSGALAWTSLGRPGFRRRSESVRWLLNESFADNPHFVPVPKAEFDFQAGPLTWIVDPRLSVLADYEGAPAGVMVCIPDLNPFLRSTRSRMRPWTPSRYLRHRRRRDRAVIVFSGVASALRNEGLGSVMLHRVVRALKESGYSRLGITWVSDQNGPSLRFVEKLGATKLHDLALYKKPLEA